MTLTLLEYQKYVQHALGGGQPDDLIAQNQIINEAGRFLFSIARWKFRERPPATLSFLAPISITTATWTEATKTLISTGSFANYTYAVGDVITIESGTGATAADYTIASRVDDDSVTLTTSLATVAGNLATGDIVGTLDFPYVNLPADFGELVGYSMADSLNDSFRFTDFRSLAIKRATTVVATSYYEGAIVWPSQVSTTSISGPPRIELWPTPSSAADALVVHYRTVWTELASTASVPNIPLYIEPLLIALVRAFALGYEHGDMDARLLEVEMGPLSRNAQKQDRLLQPDYGPLMNGHMSRGGSNTRLPWNATVATS